MVYKIQCDARQIRKYNLEENQLMLNFREALFSKSVVVHRHLSHLCIHLPREPNLLNNFHLCLLLQVDRWDIHSDNRRLLAVEYPSFLSFDRGPRDRMQDGVIVSLARWQDNVGYQYADSRCRGNNEFGRVIAGSLLPMNESARRPTTS